MAVRRVTLTILGDDKDVQAKLDAVERKKKDVAGDATVRVLADTRLASTDLDKLKLKGDDLSRKVINLRSNVEDKDSIAKLSRLDLRLHKLNDYIAKPNIDIAGYKMAVAQIDDVQAKLDRLGHSEARARLKLSTSESTHRSTLSRLTSLFGGGGDKGGGGGGEGGSGGAAKGLLSSLAGASNQYTGIGIAGLIAAGASLAPAMIPFGIGSAVGLGGLKLGSKATKGSYAQFFDKLDLKQLKSVMGSVANDTEPLLAGLLPIFNQLGSFIKRESGPLKTMFADSLPFMKAWVAIFEHASKQLIPAFTRSLEEITPELPQLIKGFTIVLTSLGPFLRALGPGMKASASVFVGMAKFIAATVKILGVAISGTAIVFNSVGKAIQWFVRETIKGWKMLTHDIRQWWDDAWGWISGSSVKGTERNRNVLNRFTDGIRHLWDSFTKEIGRLWNDAWSWVKNTATAATDRIGGDIQHWAHDVAKWFSNLGTDIKHWWGDAWEWIKQKYNDISGWIGSHVEQWWHNISGYFDNIRRDVSHAWGQMWSDIKGAASSAVNWIGNKLSAIKNAFAGPFQWVADHVLKPLAGIWNTIDKKILGNALPSFPGIPSFNSGGWVPGRGSPNVDSTFAHVAPGERILSHAEISHFGGPSAVDAVFGQARKTGTGSFSGGGWFSDVTSFFGGIAKDTLSAIGNIFPGAGTFLKDLTNAAAGSAINFFAKPIMSHFSGSTGIGALTEDLAVKLIRGLVTALATATQSAGGGSGIMGMKNPLRKIHGLHPERIDMGVDFSGSGPIFAIADGVITNTLNSGWPGGAFISERLTGSPYAGKYVYFAEDITPTVHRGQKVGVNTEIGRMHGGIEAGWAQPPGTGLALGHTQFNGSDVTAYGYNFAQLLHALGAPMGIKDTSIHGKIGRGFYNPSKSAMIGNVGSMMADGRDIYNYLLANLFGGDRIAAAGAIASIWGESGWNPDSQGTGGRGLIGWTPASRLPNRAFTGNKKTDMERQLPLILAFVRGSGDMGAIAAMKRAKSVEAAGLIWDHQVERAGISDLHAEGVTLAKRIAGLKRGGIIREHILGYGLSSGMGYEFGEGNIPEAVTPLMGPDAVRGIGGHGPCVHFEGCVFTSNEAAQEIHQIMRKYKKHRGNQKLGLD